LAPPPEADHLSSGRIEPLLHPHPDPPLLGERLFATRIYVLVKEAGEGDHGERFAREGCSKDLPFQDTSRTCIRPYRKRAALS
jgi:hypothetical protein